MPHSFQFDIVLPEAPLPSRQVTAIDVPAYDGRMTVMAHHQPLIAALKEGTMVVTDETGLQETWTISAGALQMEGNVATLLARTATLESRSTSHEEVEE